MDGNKLADTTDNGRRLPKAFFFDMVARKNHMFSEFYRQPTDKTKIAATTFWNHLRQIGEKED